jgi:hypothetical protein
MNALFFNFSFFAFYIACLSQVVGGEMDGRRKSYLFIYFYKKEGVRKKIHFIFTKNLLRIYDRRAEATRKG